MAQGFNAFSPAFLFFSFLFLFFPSDLHLSDVVNLKNDLLSTMQDDDAPGLTLL